MAEYTRKASTRSIFTMYALIARSATLLTFAAVTHASRGDCDPITISIDTDMNYGADLPYHQPDSPALMVTGAIIGANGVGDLVLRDTTQCAYFYQPDSDALKADMDCLGTPEECAEAAYDSEPTYTGSDWMRLMTDADCAVRFDTSVPDDSPLRVEGYVHVDSDGHVTIGGLPLYQSPTDDEGNCMNNYGPWASVGPDGASPQARITQRTLPNIRQHLAQDLNDRFRP